MNKQSTLTSFVENKLVIDNGVNKIDIKFKAKIDQIEDFDSIVVVMVDPEISPFLNENIFGVSHDGKILWQIEKIPHVYEKSPYTGMGKSDNQIKISNWDGTDLLVNPETGEIITKSFSK